MPEQTPDDRLTDDELHELINDPFAVWAVPVPRQLATELLELRERVAEIEGHIREVIDSRFDEHVYEFETRLTAELDQMRTRAEAAEKLADQNAFEVGRHIAAAETDADRATALEQHLAAIELGRPRRIETAEELDALPVGSIIVTASGLARQKVRGWADTGWGWTSAGGMSVRDSAYVLDVAGPTVTLVWTPGGEQRPTIARSVREQAADLIADNPEYYAAARDSVGNIILPNANGMLIADSTTTRAEVERWIRRQSTQPMHCATYLAAIAVLDREAVEVPNA